MAAETNHLYVWPDGNLKQLPAGLTNLVSIATDDFRATALREDGSIVAWGGTLNPEAPPTDLSNVVAIAPGIAVLANGSVVSWARGATVGPGILFTPPDDLTNVVAVSVSTGYSIIFLLDTGAVRTFPITQPPPGATNIVAVSVGGDFVALRGDGQVFSWPTAGFPGQVFVPTPDLNSASAIAAGHFHNLALVAETAPRFIPQVSNRIGTLGQPLAFYAPATGELPIKYQWFHENAELAGETNLILRIARMDNTRTGTYKVVAVNPRGTAEEFFRITAATPVTLTEAPSDQITWVGGSAKFTVRAAGEDLRYQWQHNGRAVAGETNASLTIADAVWADSGHYSVVVRSGVSSITSPSAQLTLTPIAWWGLTYPSENEKGQRDLSAPVTNIFALSQNPTYTLVLQKDGLLQPWGILVPPPPFPVPTATDNIAALAPGGGGAVVTRQGRVLKWNSSSWVPVPDLENVVAVSDDLAVLTSDGRLQGGGMNTPAGLTNIASFSAVGGKGAAVDFTGKVTIWPENGHVSGRVESITNAVAVVASGSQLLVLKADGAGVLARWIEYPSEPNPEDVPPDLNHLIAAFAGYDELLALEPDGTLLRSFLGIILPSPKLENIVAADGALPYTGVAAIGSGPPQFLPAVHQRNAASGAPLLLYSRAAGQMPISYQWQRDGRPLNGETNVVLALSPFEASQAGTYTLVAMNEFGTSSQRFYVYTNAPIEPQWVGIQIVRDQVSFEILDGIPGGQYTLETTDTLKGDWQASGVQPLFDALSGTFRFTVSDSERPLQFFRLRPKDGPPR